MYPKPTCQLFVGEAAGGLQAVEQAEELQPDLIIADLAVYTPEIPIPFWHFEPVGIA